LNRRNQTKKTISVLIGNFIGKNERREVVRRL